MGYSYGWSSSGRQVLSCDSCGEAEGRTKRRICPRKVVGDSIRMPNGKRSVMPYCYPPALCDACWNKHGRTKGIHGDCAQGAAKMTEHYNEIERRYQAGDGVVLSASGSWAEGVPDGMVSVTFGFPNRDPEVYLMPKDDYNMNGYLTDHPSAVPMPEAEPTTTKQVSLI